MACRDRPSNKYIGTNGFFTYLFINLCFGLGCGIISLIEDMLTKDFCVSVIVLCREHNGMSEVWASPELTHSCI